MTERNRKGNTSMAQTAAGRLQWRAEAVLCTHVCWPLLIVFLHLLRMWCGLGCLSDKVSHAAPSSPDPETGWVWNFGTKLIYSQALFQALLPVHWLGLECTNAEALTW